MNAALINHSTLVSTGQLEAIWEALTLQMRRDIAPGWEVAPLHLSISDDETAPPDSVPFVFLDDADQADALGYHDLDPDGRPYVRVFARPVLEEGQATVLGPPDAGAGAQQLYSVSSVASHEAAELLIDRYCGFWCDGPITAPDGRVFAEVSVEVADPGQGFGYAKVLRDGQRVLVSNFVLPAWFDRAAPAGTKTDYLGVCSGPLNVAAGGYVIVRNAPGTEEDVFARIPPPAWRTQMARHPAARTARRLRNSRCASVS